MMSEEVIDLVAIDELRLIFSSVSSVMVRRFEMLLVFLVTGVEALVPEEDAGHSESGFPEVSG